MVIGSILYLFVSGYWFNYISVCEWLLAQYYMFVSGYWFNIISVCEWLLVQYYICLDAFHWLYHLKKEEDGVFVLLFSN